MRSLLVAFACLGLAACGKSSESSLGRMPNDRGHSVAVPELDAGIPFDFRWARIDPAAHEGETRTCDVVLVGVREGATHRVERRYGREVADRLTVRCRARTGEAWLDVIFPPAAAGFAQRIRAGSRLTVEVVSAFGGFDGTTVGEFRAVTDLPDAGTIGAEDETTATSAGFDFRQIEGHPELVGTVQPCSVAWVGQIDRIATEQADRFPSGATHILSIACTHARGDSRVDLVATPRSAPDLLAIRRGSRIRVRILALRGGAADEPLGRLQR